MGIITKDGRKITSFEALHEEYGYTLTNAGPGGKVGDRKIRGSISFICDECGSHGKKGFRQFIPVLGKDFTDYTKEVLCGSCQSKSSKLKKYGDKTFNNRKKAKQTCNIKYGKDGAPRLKQTKQKISEALTGFYNSPLGMKRRKTLSISQKKFLSDKRNHPMYGKTHSSESIEKNRNTNLKNLLSKSTEVPHLSNRYDSGIFYSTKLRKEFYYRSSYERNFFYILDNCESILWYSYETLRIPYEYGGKSKVYTPDFLVTDINNKTFLIEIKPRKLMNHPKNIAKFKYAREYVEGSPSIHEFLVLGEADMISFPFKHIQGEPSFTPVFMEKLQEVLPIIAKTFI